MAPEKKQVLIKKGKLVVQEVKSKKSEPLSFYNLKLKQKESYTDVGEVRILELIGPKASRYYVQGIGSDGTKVSRSISKEGAEVVMTFYGLGATEQRAAKPRKVKKKGKTTPKTKKSPTRKGRKMTKKTTRKTTKKSPTRKTTKKSPTRKTTKKSPTRKTTKKSPTRKTTKKSPTRKTTKKSPTRKTTKKSPTRKTVSRLSPITESRLMKLKRPELVTKASNLAGFDPKMNKKQLTTLILSSRSPVKMASGTRRSLSPKIRRTTKRTPKRSA